MTYSETTRDIFVTGLRNAHAMENEALSVMRPQVARLESYPEMKALLERHIYETEGQIDRLAQIFASLDESPSAFKDTVLSVMGSMAAMGHAVASDEILKNGLADYMFEHFEIAAYTSLITMAKFFNLQTAIPLLEQNLAEERAMAAAILDGLPNLTETFLSRSESGLQAKV